MGVIWYAIGIYIVGIAVVLFVRPTSMFRPGGTWKEFGLSTEGNFTVFPFWMFSLIWAVVSFAIANMFQIFFASTVLQSIAPSVESVAQNTNTNIGNIIQPISSASPAVAAPTMPVSAPMTTSQRIPGYYVLESVLKNTEQPRYVYWGPEPPSMK